MSIYCILLVSSDLPKNMFVSVFLKTIKLWKITCKNLLFFVCYIWFLIGLQYLITRFSYPILYIAFNKVASEYGLKATVLLIERSLNSRYPLENQPKSTESIDTRSNVLAEFLHSSLQESAFHSGMEQKWERRKGDDIVWWMPIVLREHLHYTWKLSRGRSHDFVSHFVLPEPSFFSQPIPSIFEFVGL